MRIMKKRCLLTCRWVSESEMRCEFDMMGVQYSRYQAGAGRFSASHPPLCRPPERKGREGVKEKGGWPASRGIQEGGKPEEFEVDGRVYIIFGAVQHIIGGLDIFGLILPRYLGTVHTQRSSIKQWCCGGRMDGCTTAAMLRSTRVRPSAHFQF